MGVRRLSRSSVHFWSGEGRTLTIKRTINGSPNVTKTVSYTYNTDGSVANLTYPSGFVLVHQYSAVGRLTGVGNGAGTTYYGKDAT